MISGGSKGVAPSFEATKAPTRQAFSSTFWVLIPRVSPIIRPAMKESPAPTVSLMATLGAGAHTRLPLSQSTAPSAALVTQIREVLVAFAKTAQASGRASGLRG